MKKSTNINQKQMVLAAIFSAIIIVMTVVPYTGYINYGGIAELTTLHAITIIGACCMTPIYGAIVGGVWGSACVLRAVAMSSFAGTAPFINPIVSLLPRVLVGLFASLVFLGLKKVKCPLYFNAIISSIVGSLTNTIFVLTFYCLFNQDNSGFMTIMKTIIATLGTVNGLIELGMAVVIVPPVIVALNKSINR